jgi:PilZ domain-containing protein
MGAVLSKPAYSRRLSSRIDTPEGVWVYWRCGPTEDVSRVCDLSVGGLFLSTPIPQPRGVTAQLEFLVQEGNIRAEAVVRHLIPSNGLGLKFTAISDQDCPNLLTLMNRMRGLSGPWRAN